MNDQQHTSTITPNEYVGKHRPDVVGGGASWRPSPEYGDAPTVQAGIGLSLGVEPHLVLTDLMGGMVRVDLSPEDVEHVLVEARLWQERFEARVAEQSRAIEASLDRQDRFYQAHPRSVA